MGVCNYEKEIYICAYIGFFIEYVNIYIKR